MAAIVRPQGIHGEAKIRLLCSDADLLQRCIETGVLLLSGAGPPGGKEGGERELNPIALGIVRSRGDFAVVRIDGVDSRDQVEALRGRLIGLRQGRLPALEKGWFYHYQLEGLDVFDLSGKRLGRIERIEEAPAHDRIVVAPDDAALKPFRIPYVEDIVRRVDLVSGRVDVDLPKGLIESQQ
ncbi:16S rRNA processing protein RimM [Candidatus Sumerlaeota bacterium]|nr:16S rRNA processing protein RimM [Candidatus Sumerlaeota bacterium]